jgi:hypothetical protein
MRANLGMRVHESESVDSDGNNWSHVTLECPAVLALPMPAGKGERKGDGQHHTHDESEI